MGNITVKFIDKEYSISTDVITYVGLLDFTNDIRDALMALFKKQICSKIDVMDSDDFMVTAFNDQASKFVRKLLDNDIYDRTAKDYIQNNKGYELFLDTKRKIVAQIIAIRKAKLESYRAGVEGAIQRKEMAVTGLDFGIVSGSFVNHMIYAYMDASKQTEQEKAAMKAYTKEIAELEKQNAEYDKQEATYISENVIPAMTTVFTFFAYELLDKYVSDLIAVGKFDSIALNFLNLERSNDLLQNLALSDNKQAVLQSAFSACPFNLDVYMQAIKYDLLDYDSFQTARVFRQSGSILSFLEENFGEVSFPKKFGINYHYVELMALFTERSSMDILHSYTESYVEGIVQAYSDIADMVSNQELCIKAMSEYEENILLEGNIVCKKKAYSYINDIVPNEVWHQLTEKCGHFDIVDKIKMKISMTEDVTSKKQIDSILVENLLKCLIESRFFLVGKIIKRRESEEELRIYQEFQKEEKQERSKNILKNILLTTLLIICCPFNMALILVVVSYLFSNFILDLIFLVLLFIAPIIALVIIWMLSKWKIFLKIFITVVYLLMALFFFI